MEIQGQILKLNYKKEKLLILLNPMINKKSLSKHRFWKQLKNLKSKLKIKLTTEITIKLNTKIHKILIKIM